MDNRISRIWNTVRNVSGITLIMLLLVIPGVPLFLVIIGFIVFCVLDHIITSEFLSIDSDNTSVKQGSLPQAAVVASLGESPPNEALGNVQSYILNTINNNQSLITNYNIPDKYLDAKLIGTYIYKDGFYISGITLKQWVLYVLGTNKDIRMEWVHDINTLDPTYSYVRDKQGIRFKLPGNESSIILFKEEMGELYPSYVSDGGAALVDLSVHPNLKENTVNALTTLTNMAAFTQ